jgi:hypothetical protein
MTYIYRYCTQLNRIHNFSDRQSLLCSWRNLLIGTKMRIIAGWRRSHWILVSECCCALSWQIRFHHRAHFQKPAETVSISQDQWPQSSQLSSFLLLRTAPSPSTTLVGRSQGIVRPRFRPPTIRPRPLSSIFVYAEKICFNCSALSQCWPRISRHWKNAPKVSQYGPGVRLK